jgi:hypothetical protein
MVLSSSLIASGVLPSEWHMVVARHPDALKNLEHVCRLTKADALSILPHLDAKVKTE